MKGITLVRNTGEEMRKAALIAAVLVAGCGPAMAQTACPQGVAVGSARCGPGGGGIPWSIGFLKPKPTWRRGWGAFARNDAQSIIGVSTGTRSPEAAARGAIRGCRSAGGEGCEVFFTYRDSCAAIAKPGGTDAVQPTYHVEARSEEEASGLVLETCSQAHEGLACEVIYSNCSTGFHRY
ncbi:DUF4189 domain-containing protein [Luteimonas sp. SDU101]|uniref:DUF4189 domain-containing protein n=1 Tax=Luteimonas sp. SDU101 TaxID=3422593 RepID=UPI003EBF01CA